MIEFKAPNSSRSVWVNPMHVLIVKASNSVGTAIECRDELIVTVDGEPREVAQRLTTALHKMHHTPDYRE